MGETPDPGRFVPVHAAGSLWECRVCRCLVVRASRAAHAEKCQAEEPAVVVPDDAPSVA